MSDSYLVLVSERSPDALLGRSAGLVMAELKPIFRGGVIHVFAGADTPWTPLPGGQGIILGTIFDRGNAQECGVRALRRLPQNDRARWILDALWGRYLVVQATDDQNVDILRDPTGQLACYSASTTEALAFAPDARTLQRGGLIKGSIDWLPATRSLAFPDLRMSQTGLVGVSEPVPGDLIRWSRQGVTTKTLWSPARFCREQQEGEFATCAQLVCERVDEVVGAWTRTTSKALLSLSGGLDSSIIAASALDPSDRLAAFNIRSGRGRGDEREFARALAKQFGITLEEHDISRGDVDLGISLAADQPQPSARSFTQPFDRFAADLADRTGAALHLNGGGGDNVFAFLHSANPAADRLRAEGLGRGFFRSVRELAELTQCTSPYIAWRAMTKAWLKPNRFAWPVTPALLAPDFVAALPAPRHPWLADEGRMRPGQREHVASIARAVGLVGHLNVRDHRPTIYPLLSQPLIELCLSIPTWFCCKDGRDRAVARAAFAERLPSSILARRTKGAVDGVIVTTIQRHRSRLREILLDGNLVRHGILAKVAVEQAIDAAAADGRSAGRLLQCADVEAWARCWAS